MTEQFNSTLAQFTPSTAEKIYGELYQYCASEQMDEQDAQEAFAHMMVWFEVQIEPLAQSYGLLTLGGLIDNGKLKSEEVAPQVSAFFKKATGLVTDFQVLDHENRFVHFVSHFAYLAGSCCEQFNDTENELVDIVVSLVELFLAAPDAYYCGEELLVARAMLEAYLTDDVFEEMLSKLSPEQVMQEADDWDAAAVNIWGAGTIRENHKRQLIMALHGLNLLLKEKPNSVFKPLLVKILEAKFG